MNWRILLTAAGIGLLAGAGMAGILAVHFGRRGRAGNEDAYRRIPGLLLIAFILLVFAALTRAADVALTACGWL